MSSMNPESVARRKRKGAAHVAREAKHPIPRESGG